MSEYNRKKHLEQLHAQRRADTNKKVDETIRFLIKNGKPINFNSVANESGISKATLYNNSDIRERIELLRQQQVQAPTASQARKQIDENNKDAIIESLKRKIKKLEVENKKLNDQLKVAYGDIYKSI